jgi:hypothetical protein
VFFLDAKPLRGPHPARVQDPAARRTYFSASGRESHASRVCSPGFRSLAVFRRHALQFLLVSFLFRTLLFFLLASSLASAAERQHHGVVFEQWVRDTFFDGYRPPGYTQKWDIPAEVNTRHGGIPVNPKAARYKGPVDLGDALRQFDIDEPFWLIIGYWEDADGSRKIVAITAVRVEPDTWRKLWGGITRTDLEKLDAEIKDRSLTPEEARKRAQAIKRQPPFTDAAITLNPKIDSKTQRRLQCSLSFPQVFRLLAPDESPRPQPVPALWGTPWPGF